MDRKVIVSSEVPQPSASDPATHTRLPQAPEKMPISESKLVLPQVETVTEAPVPTNVYQTFGDPIASVPLVLHVGNASFVAPTVVSPVSDDPHVRSVALAQLSLPITATGITELACNDP